MINHFNVKIKPNSFFWKKRYEYFSEIINRLDGKYVYDLGCGDCSLNRYLIDKTYIGYDCNKSNEAEFFNVNFNIVKSKDKFYWGETSDRIAAVLGLIEYIEDVEEFVEFIANNFQWCVCSCGDGVGVNKKYGLNDIIVLLLKHFNLLKIDKIQIDNRVGYYYTLKKQVDYV